MSEQLPSVCVGEFTSEDEARHVAAILEGEGIPCKVVRRDTFGAAPILGSGYPFGGEVLVPPEWEERALDLLDEAFKGLPEESPEEAPEGDAG